MTNEVRVLAWLDEHQDELYDYLSRLTQVDTQNYITHGLEAQGQPLVEQFCIENGWTPDRYDIRDIPGITEHPGYLANRGMEERPNVSTVIPGTAPRRRIMIAAHMDTMPIGDPEQWSVPPLGGIIRDGRIWGRGVSDNKGGIASGMFALKALKECGIALKDDVVFTSYADEEYGGGDGALAACLRYPCDLYINLDGQDLNLCPWGVGGCIYDFSVRYNKSTETAIPTYEAVGKAVEQLKQFAALRDTEFSKSKVYCNSREREQCMRLLGVTIGNNGNDLGMAKLTFVFYTLQSREETEKELYAMRDVLTEQLKELDFTVGDFIPQTRFFIPHMPETICGDALAFGKACDDVRGVPTPTLGACLSDLSVFGNFGGGEAFNHGLVKGFEAYGGAHQNDENITCKDLLDVTKAMAVYLIRNAL